MSRSFNTRLLFSTTTISRLQQKSRDQAAAGKGEGEAGKKAALSWPAEISAQLRKLFDGELILSEFTMLLCRWLLPCEGLCVMLTWRGVVSLSAGWVGLIGAKLPVPKELEGGEALGSEGGRRRSAAISDKVALQMVRAPSVACPCLGGSAAGPETRNARGVLDLLLVLLLALLGWCQIKDDLYKRDSAMRMEGKGGPEAWKRLVDRSGGQGGGGMEDRSVTDC